MIRRAMLPHVAMLRHDIDGAGVTCRAAMPYARRLLMIRRLLVRCYLRVIRVIMMSALRETSSLNARLPRIAGARRLPLRARYP